MLFTSFFFTDDLLDTCLEVLEDMCNFLWKNFIVFQVCQGNPIDLFLLMLVVKLLAVRLHQVIEANLMTI